MRKMYLKSAILAATLIFSLGAAPADSAKTEKTIGVSTVYAAEASQPESEEGDPVKRNTFENSDSYDSAPLYGDWKSDSADMAGTVYTVSGIKNIDKPSKNQIITRYSSVKNNVITKVYQTSPSAKNPYSIGRLDSTFVNSGLTFLNFYRYVGGLGTVSLDQNLMYGNSGAQYGAVLLAASKNADSSFRLSHYPPRPADMSSDFYNSGSTATSTSNISMRSGYNPLYSLQQSIYGCMKDKNSNEMVDIITSGLDNCEYLAVSIEYGRAEEPYHLAQMIRDAGCDCRACASTAEALETAMKSGADCVLSAGSIYLAGDLRSLYKIK
jgi:hypothetical protein